MKIYFIAGEESGDYIGSRIMFSLRQLSLRKNIPIEFAGIGGNLMENQGIKSLFPINLINVMGLVEIIPHIKKISELINSTVEDVAYENPDILVTIDSPGFTGRVAKKIKSFFPQIKLVHVVAPSVWAYKPGRAKKYAKIYDHLLALLPFEPPYFQEVGLPCTYIGHPIFEQEFVSKSDELRSELGISPQAKIIAVTPGSRKSEIKRHMPVLVQVLSKIAQTRDIHAIFVQNGEGNVGLISDFLNQASFKYSFSMQRLTSFAAADVAIAKSGTNNLEIAASGTAQIIAYKLNQVTYLLIKLIIKIRFACLINILANKEIVPEYIQDDFTQDNLIFAISDLLDDNQKIKSQVHESQKWLQSIGFNSDDEQPSKKAAQKIIEIYDTICLNY